MNISKETERRFVLGEQGLWPGRRWQGRAGIRSAISTCRGIQVDPLNVVGRSHDLAFASRVFDYRPEDLESILYKERAAFEYGGTLNIHPRDRLGLLASASRYEVPNRQWKEWYRKNSEVPVRVLGEIDRLGPQESRHWREGARTDNYRSRREEGVALHYLWRRFDILIHHREGNRKFYDLTERIFGPLPPPLPLGETQERLALETLTWLGLTAQYGLAYVKTLEGGRERPAAIRRRIRQALLDDGLLAEVNVEGERGSSVLRADQLPLLETVAAGEVPKTWRPKSEIPEAVFLAPLDVVSARDRARRLFDFEYLWEVYTPKPKRRWGYYVLPILFRDRIVGRAEPTFDSDRGELRIPMAMWESGTNLAEVAEPFARGIRRMLERLGGKKVRLGRVGPSGFKSRLTELLRSVPQ